MRISIRFALVALITSLAALWGRAEAPDQQIARVSYVNGDASYLRGDDADRNHWVALGINTPLTTGDSLYAGSGARTEVTLEGGNALRMDGGTEVDVVNLTSGVSQFGLSSGRADLRVQTLPGGGAVEVDTPGGAATLEAPGTYRFFADGNGSTLGVLSGRLSATVAGQQVEVRSGEELRLAGTSSPTYDVARLDGPDAFDTWSQGRDRRVEDAVSARYVNHRVNGYEDLDSSGRWHDDPSYGHVWVPSGVPAGWAPYQDGSWIWQDPYGWTWVSYEPWGWAPYHYGRWVCANNVWGWVPPPPAYYAAPPVVAAIQPVYAPALVGFVGFGGSGWSLGVSLGFGAAPAVGWVPLAPADPFFYPWQPGFGVTNVTYTNINVVNACTVVRRSDFGVAPVAPMRVSAAELRQARVLGASPAGVVPTAASLAAYPTRRVDSRAIPSAAVLSRPLMARRTPPPRPLSLAEKLPEIRSSGRPVARPLSEPSPAGQPLRAGATSPHGGRYVSAMSPSSTTQALRPASPWVTRRTEPLQGNPARASHAGPHEQPPTWTPGTPAPHGRAPGTERWTPHQTPPPAEGRAINAQPHPHVAAPPSTDRHTIPSQPLPHTAAPPRVDRRAVTPQPGAHGAAPETGHAWTPHAPPPAANHTPKQGPRANPAHPPAQPKQGHAKPAEPASQSRWTPAPPSPGYGRYSAPRPASRPAGSTTRRVPPSRAIPTRSGTVRSPVPQPNNRRTARANL